ncbi:hypothetical protein EXIGLDRAFT_725836 [Exidia glandulosa HHB12029]|uniref:Uncharacterized protein n=1 Tax=Exidia glandulosa HHB12029 TaxID=1314781 RepID=A0A165MFQ2_EXIGL|nr:hypothetical protein EXIGLDRAFT_725836 [Exidia glandulosa HHB12029]
MPAPAPTSSPHLIMSSQQPIPPNPYGGGSGGQESRGFAPGQSPGGNLMFQYSAPPSNPASPPRQGMQNPYPGAQPRQMDYGGRVYPQHQPPPPPPPRQPHPQAYMQGYSQGSPMPAVARTHLWLGHQTQYPAEPLLSTPPTYQAPPTVTNPQLTAQMRGPQWKPKQATPHMPAVNAAHAVPGHDASGYVDGQKLPCKYRRNGCTQRVFPSLLAAHETSCDKSPEAIARARAASAGRPL